MKENAGKVNMSESQVRAREKDLLARLAKLDALEEEILGREKELKARDAKRKQIILRIPESLWREISEWADDDFRSVNGQIEYLLSRSVREREKK